MRYGDIVDRVHERVGTESVLEADRATRAVIGTLGQRLAACPNRRVAYQLPAPLALELPEHEPPLEFGVTEFLERVVHLGGAATVPEAAHRTHAVGTVLRETMKSEDLDEVLAQLPPDFQHLLGTGQAAEVDLSASPATPSD